MKHCITECEKKCIMCIKRSLKGFCAANTCIIKCINIMFIVNLCLYFVYAIALILSKFGIDFHPFSWHVDNATPP